MPTPIGYEGYQGEAPRKTRRTVVIALVVLLIMGAVFVYAVAFVGHSSPKEAQATYLVDPGVSCSSPNLPKNVSQVEQSPAFAAASGGSCYNYVSQNEVTISGVVNESLGFDLFNGSVVYPCGTYPVPLIQSSIEVAVAPGPSVESVQVDNDSASLNGPYTCGVPPSAVGISSVQYIEVTIPAIPELNVTLENPQGGQPVTSLSAVINLAGNNYTFAFTGVTRASPLLPGQSVSATQVIGTEPIGNASQLHIMSITEGLLDGGTLNYEVQFVVANTYADT